MPLAYVDPFGAPEFFVDGVAYREMVGTEFVRSTFFAKDRDELIIRVKLMIPIAVCNAEYSELRTFIDGKKQLRLVR